MVSRCTQLAGLCVFLLFFIFCLYGVISREPAYALPNIAAEYGQSCFLCHVDPTGGGPRNLYGGQFYARTELPTWPDGIDEMNKFNPQINKWLTLGADLRVLHSDVEDAPMFNDQIMQGAIHLTAQLHPKYTMYISKDWNTDYQAAGIAHILPEDGYIKVGRFLPNYGLRPDDHTLYIRDGLFGSATYSDVGLEVGFHPQDWEFAASILRGTSGAVNDDKSFAFSARTAYRLRVQTVNLMLGGSLYGDEYINGDGEQFWYGPFYGANYGPVTFMGEVDFTEDLPASLESGGLTENPVGLISSQMLFCEIYQGCLLKVCHDFQDYDIDWKTGSRQRYTGGVQWFPYGFLEIQANIRYIEIEERSGNTTDNIQFDGQIHLFF